MAKSPRVDPEMEKLKLLLEIAGAALFWRTARIQAMAAVNPETFSQLAIAEDELNKGII